MDVSRSRVPYPQGLKIKVLRSFETLVIVHMQTVCSIPEDLNIQIMIFYDILDQRKEQRVCAAPHIRCSCLWSIVKIATGHVHDSKQTRVITAQVHPATCNLAHWITRHGSPTIHRCFALPQLLYRWRHQFGKFWIPSRNSEYIRHNWHVSKNDSYTKL
jgi:hypothetical protein